MLFRYYKIEKVKNNRNYCEKIINDLLKFTILRKEKELQQKR